MVQLSYVNQVIGRGLLHRKSPLQRSNDKPARIYFTVKIPRGQTGLHDFYSCVSTGDVALQVETIPLGNFVAVEGGIRSSSTLTPQGKRFETTISVWKISSYCAASVENPPSFDIEEEAAQ